VVLEPDNAALLAAKTLAVGDMALREKVLAYQEQQRQRLYAADKA
jgi:phosphoribosylcarboxyaminoimidazole (NCAIR) mutase